jgi:hypothetical protein
LRYWGVLAIVPVLVGLPTGVKRSPTAPAIDGLSIRINQYAPFH